MIDFTGKQIIVTGASQGIGRATAVLLSRYGAKVILIARSKEGLEETLRLMESPENSNHSLLPFDLSNPERIGCLCEDIKKTFGKVDGMAYCAGITQYVPIRFSNIEDFEDIMHVNTLSFYEMIKCLSKKGYYEEGTSFVGCSSVAAIFGQKAHSFYAASKGAMDSMTRCIAKELAPKNIRINLVAPGRIKTPMVINMQKMNIESVHDNESFFERQYLGLGEPEDVANAILFLLSPASKFITGVTLPVDGGYSSN